MICEDIGASPHIGRIILGADEAARSRGYNLVIINVPSSSSAEPRAAAVDSLLARRVDGILFAAASHGPAYVRLDFPPSFPANLGTVPAVLLGPLRGDAGSHAGLPAVVPDEDSGARAAVGILLGAGHTRIGFLDRAAPKNGSQTSPDRLSGFRTALSQAGLDGAAAPVQSVPVQSAPADSGPAGVQGGYEAALQMLDRKDRPTGLVCHDEFMAMGAYRAAAERGLAIPTDLSVVAFADHELIAGSLHPGLTTVALPHCEIAARAAQNLMDAAEGKPDAALPAAGKTVLAWTVDIRGSVAPPPDPATPRGNFCAAPCVNYSERCIASS